jgi:hypothetical protein
VMWCALCPATGFVAMRNSAELWCETGRLREPDAAG